MNSLDTNHNYQPYSMSRMTKHCSGSGTEDVGVTSISDSENGHSEELTAGGTELEVVTLVLHDIALGESGVVLELSLADSRSVVRDEDHLDLTVSHGSEGVAVT